MVGAAGGGVVAGVGVGVGAADGVGLGGALGLADGLALGVAGVNVRAGLADAEALGLGEASATADGRTQDDERAPIEVLEQDRLRTTLDAADALERGQERRLLRHDVLSTGHPGRGERADRGDGAVRGVRAVIGVAPGRARHLRQPEDGGQLGPLEGRRERRLEPTRTSRRSTSPRSGLFGRRVEEQDDRAIGRSDRERVGADVVEAGLVEEGQVAALERGLGLSACHPCGHRHAHQELPSARPIDGVVLVAAGEPGDPLRPEIGVGVEVVRDDRQDAVDGIRAKDPGRRLDLPSLSVRRPREPPQRRSSTPRRGA